MTKSPASSRFKKTNISSLSATFNGYDVFDPDYNVDLSLRTKLSTEGYDKLNEIIRSNVYQIYKEKMMPFCEELNENARIVGREESVSTASNEITETEIKDEKEISTNLSDPPELGENWRVDPKNLQNDEILNEILKLEAAFENQRKINQEMRSEIELIRLAAKRMELEKNGLYLELKNKETGMTD